MMKHEKNGAVLVNRCTVF